MKKRVLTTLTLALLVGLTLALAGVAGAAPKKDSAKGKGEIMGGAGKFSFKAEDLDADPTTFAAEGKLTYKPNAEEIKGEVTCLHVLGQGAHFVARITESTFAPFVGRFAEVHVFDSGQRGGKGDEFFVRDFHESDPGCTAPPLPGVDPVVNGNIVVKDVVTPP